MAHQETDSPVILDDSQEKPLVNLEYQRPDLKDTPLPQLNEIWGMIPTYTTRPAATDIPKKFSEQMRLYTDDTTTPTVRELWIYSTTLNDWLYVTLST